MAAKLEKLSKLEKAGKIHKLDPVTFFVDRRFNVTNFGPTAAKIEHRQILSHYVIASNEAERRIWSQLSNSMSSYGIEIEVYGATYNEQGLFVHHYKSKIRTVACFGGKPIYYGTKDAIANFDSIKADYGAPGYKESNTRLFINKIIVHPYEQIHRGGANPGKKSEGPEIVNLAPGIWARDTPLKIGYGDLKAGEDPMKNNNCAFRAIYSQVAKNRQKWFKQQFPLKTIRKEFGLPPNCKISPDELFMICDAKGVELTIIVVRGMDPETAEISIKSTQATGHVEPMIRVILHADTEHYYCPATGKSPDNHTTDYCGVCGEAVKLKDFLKHEYIHKIRHEFKSTLELPTGLLSRGDDESMKDYSKRHREFFVNIIIEFWNNPNYEEILAFLGPGGCGKSDVIKTFREMYKDLNIVCISKTGVASQNIRGQTYDSFMMKLRSKEPVLPDMIIIDEISFLSDMELNRLDFRLREIRNKASPMGGIKTIFMGDFLQLLPFKNKSCVFTELFQNHVRAVPMMYPFRYKDDNYFFKLLLKIRSGGLHLSDFMKADFGMMTRSEWVTGFRPENRPTLLVQINEDRRMLEADARAYDLRTYEDLETYKIHLQVGRVEADPSGVPLDKEQARLVGSSKGHVYSDVEHPGHKATFCIALNSKEFDGEINSDKDTFYTRERLMTLMNKCDDKGLLMNGSEVFFHSIQNVGGEEFMVVETMDGELCSIPKYKRGCNLKGTFYICEGFPVQSAMVTTVFKAQGKTYPAVVVDVPRCNMNKNTQHLYYVALSRCTTSKTVKFMVRDKTFSSDEEGLVFVHKRLFGKSGEGQPLVCHHPVMVGIMAYAETGGSMKLCTALDQFNDSNEISFPSTNDTVYWQPKVPNQTKDDEEHRKFLFHNIIFFDIETGAAVGHERHHLYYDKDTGEFIADDNYMRHEQTAWLISFLHIRDSKIVWLKDEVDRVVQSEDKEFLLELSKMQKSDGIVYIHLKEPDNNYCSILFTLYLILEAERLAEKKEDMSKIKLSRSDRLPCYLVGYNSDSFDIKTVLHSLDQSEIELPPGFKRNVIRNSGTAITRLSIVNRSWKKIGDLIATHDLFRYHGCQPKLSACHKTYMSSPFGTDKEKYEEFISKYTYDTTIIKNLTDHLILGKSEFPHLLTQREGYMPTLNNELKTYELEDYPVNMRYAVQSEESRTFKMYEKSHEYMRGDIYVLVGAYIGANEANIQSGLRVPILSLNTAQQLTTANQLYVGSEIKGLITHGTIDQYSEKRQFKTLFSLPDLFVQDIIDKATFGGKTLPRVIHWDQENGSGSYNQVDESGMYADAQEKKNYPYGPHYHTTATFWCNKVLESFQRMQSGDQMNDPAGERLIFPFMYIAEVTIKIPSLCVDPYIPFKNAKGELDWGICDPVKKDPKDSEETKSKYGTRRQWLCSITIGLLKDMGGELLEVHGVLFWESYGPYYRKYVSELNYAKYTTKDAVIKENSKLKVNANYGASMKRDKDTITRTIYDMKDWNEVLNLIDWRGKAWDSMYMPNGTLVVQGHTKACDSPYSSRPTYLGTFVLAHSQFKLAHMAMVGAGPTYTPKTLDDAREGLINLPLYGDTDSLFLHETYINRLLEHADNGGTNYLYDTSEIKDMNNVTNAEKIAKLGRYCDEVANDYKCGHMVNYRQGVYTKVVLFGAGGPKAYGALLQAPDGQIIPKNRIKGIKEDAFTFYVTDDGSDKRTIDGDNIKFSKKAEAITRLIHKAVRTPGAYISTFYRQSFKSYGFIPQGHERVTNDAGQIKRAEPWTQCITNVRRDVLKEVTSRRRLLTSEEVKYLGLNEYDASRILVPNGWNWDGALFRLI
jgi:hypothetical protein